MVLRFWWCVLNHLTHLRNCIPGFSFPISWHILNAYDSLDLGESAVKLCHRSVGRAGFGLCSVDCSLGFVRQAIQRRWNQTCVEGVLGKGLAGEPRVVSGGKGHHLGFFSWHSLHLSYLILLLDISSTISHTHKNHIIELYIRIMRRIANTCGSSWSECPIFIIICLAFFQALSQHFLVISNL